MMTEDSKPELKEIAVVQPNSAQPDLSTADSRRAAVDAYKQEVFEKTGTRLGRKDFCAKAGYKCTTEFERWLRTDPKKINKAHRNFVRVLTEKPHLK